MTFHFELNNRANKQGKYVIFLRITENRRNKRVQTSIELSRQKDWNKTTETVRKSEPYHIVWNTVLSNFKEQAKSIARELTDEDGLPSIEEVAVRLNKKENKDTLIAFMKDLMEGQEKNARWGSRGKYGDTCNKLQMFLNSRGLQDIPLKNVSPMFVEKFEQFLLTLPNRKDATKTRTLHPNTIAKHKKTLKAVLNKAIEDRILKPGSLPANLTRIKEIPSEMTGLEDSELQKLMDVQLEPNTPIWHARNIYFMAIYCCGARLGDIMQFRWLNFKDGRLQYQMRKVSKKLDMILVPEALRILDWYRTDKCKPTDYVFPYLDSSAKYAEYISLEDRRMMPNDLSSDLYRVINVKQVDIGNRLKKLADLAGVEHFTFHSARHTFAMKANSAGTDNYLLKEMMNHSSLAITQVYMQRLDHSRQDAALQNIFKDKDESICPVPMSNDTEKNKKLEQIMNQKIMKAQILLGELGKLGLDSEVLKALLS